MGGGGIGSGLDLGEKEDIFFARRLLFPVLGVAALGPDSVGVGMDFFGAGVEKLPPLGSFLGLA